MVEGLVETGGREFVGRCGFYEVRLLLFFCVGVRFIYMFVCVCFYYKNKELKSLDKLIRCNLED